MRGILEEYGSFIVEILLATVVVGIIYGLFSQFQGLGAFIAEKVIGGTT